MTEQQIEERAERLMDSLDRRLMSGEISQPEYDEATKSLERGIARMLQRAEVRS